MSSPARLSQPRLGIIFLLLAVSLLISGCSGSVDNPTSSSPAESSSNSSAAAAAQSPSTSPTPEKPGFLSRKTINMGGASMEPTLHNGDKLTAYPVYRELQRGDIIVFTAPDSSGNTVLKRIVGLPGENIEIRDGQVLINGAVLSESYISEPAAYVVAPTLIPEKSYYVLGDNRNQSADSHTFGTVPLDNIKLLVEP